ncbi:MAG: mechanosensitive ion channel family protein [Pseudanabaenaceae cyanobacterium]|jgi:small conductance mechanosensitive channel
MDAAAISNILTTNLNLLSSVLLKVIGAIILWFVGRKLIGIGIGLTSKAMRVQKIDPTLIMYLISSLEVLLNIILVVALLGFFGIETTSFAALLAAAGVAIGAAWSGLLANFAAGAFLIILRPFQVGEVVSIDGITGTVQEIGLFVTTINTPDNVRTIIGNNKIFSQDIKNYSVNAYRRLELNAQLDHSTNVSEVKRVLLERLVNIPNVLGNPQPQVEIIEFNDMGLVLTVRVFCHNDHYWQVYFDGNRIIAETNLEMALVTPQKHLLIKQETTPEKTQENN